MPLLYYWRGDNYRSDLDEGAAFHLNQASPRLHTLALGDSLWAFTRRVDGQYVLAAELVISAKTMNAPGYKYGPYRVWGDLQRSRYFDAGGGSPLELLVRGFSLGISTPILGRSFQGPGAVREISQTEHQLLVAFAKKQPLEPRIHHLDETLLETAVAADDQPALRRILDPANTGFAPKRRDELKREAPRRVRELVIELRTRYRNQCQLCGSTPGASLGVTVAEGHHLQWLSRGGEDSLANMALLCPNDHRGVHAADAPFDYATRAFVLPSGPRFLQLNSHLGS